ncbi:MAG: hypothetical protein QM611_09555 [Microbacterium sp.]|uniref:hypothetical protein n=1 Tax=Microbacterium sp. TaxID=51671 RepID=UPI0039E3868D
MSIATDAAIDLTAAPFNLDAGAVAWVESTECAREAVTLVKDLDGALPLSLDKTPRVLIYPLGIPGRASPASDRLAKRLNDRGFQATVFPYPDRDDLDAAMQGEFGLTVAQTKEQYDLVLYVAAIRQVSFGPTNRTTWSPLMGSNAPHGIPEVPMVFVSFDPFCGCEDAHW